MRMYDLISKKKDGQPLLTSEIQWMIQNYTTGAIPDYQMSAMLMASVKFRVSWSFIP